MFPRAVTSHAKRHLQDLMPGERSAYFAGLDLVNGVADQHKLKICYTGAAAARDLCRYYDLLAPRLHDLIIIPVDSETRIDYALEVLDQHLLRHQLEILGCQESKLR